MTEKRIPTQPEHKGPLVIKKLKDEIYQTVVTVAEESGYKIDDQQFVSQVSRAFDEIKDQFVADFLSKMNEK